MQNQLKIDQSDYKYVPVENLLYDPNNPRIPKKYEGADETAVMQYMLRDASILELMGAIAQVGFFPGEPLLVVPAPDSYGKGPGKFFVVEGNRRLTAVKLLLNPGLASIYQSTIQNIADNVNNPKALKAIPVIEYSRKEDILDYLGYRHVTGIKEWGTFEKAQYLVDLSAAEPYKSMKDDERYRALARTIGSKPEYVARLLTANKLYNRAEKQHLITPTELDNIQENFSLLTTSLYYKGIADYLNVDPKDIYLEGLVDNKYQDLLNWIFKRSATTNKAVVSESRKLKDLNLVVQNEAATLYLKDTGDLTTAAIIATAGTKLDTFRSHLNNILKLLKNASKIVDAEELEFTESDKESVETVIEEAKDLNRSITKSINRAHGG